MKMEGYMETLCPVCNKQSSGLNRCPYCKRASYCSKEHRKSDLKHHRRSCQDYVLMHGLERRSSDVALDNGRLTRAESIVHNLKEKGYCILDNFHGSEFGLSVLEEVKSLHEQGLFKDGELVSTNGNGKKDKKIREDQISWVSGTEQNCQAIARHMTVVDKLIHQCNSLLEDHDIKHRTQAMAACYPGRGAHYKRHVDNPHGDGRCITTLYYLNENWKEKNGGALNLYPGGSEEPVQIQPHLDRLLLFWSDRRNPHEVQPSYEMRYAITLWYFDDAERTRYTEELRKKALQESKDDTQEPKKQQLVKI